MPRTLATTAITPTRNTHFSLSPLRTADTFLIPCPARYVSLFLRQGEYALTRTFPFRSCAINAASLSLPTRVPVPSSSHTSAVLWHRARSARGPPGRRRVRFVSLFSCLRLSSTSCSTSPPLPYIPSPPRPYHVYIPASPLSVAGAAFPFLGFGATGWPHYPLPAPLPCNPFPVLPFRSAPQRVPRFFICPSSSTSLFRTSSSLVIHRLDLYRPSAPPLLLSPVRPSPLACQFLSFLPDWQAGSVQIQSCRLAQRLFA
ncbi:hypothetical protein K438DRAFT_236087 [Mycena galopus ATCC 62051]|nr:hypothetical protein K438DRAFT_236087 [Mycena galopus ATCC 62051]